MNIIVEKSSETRYFQLFWADLTSLWHWYDLAMTLGYQPCEIQPHSIATCLLRLGLIICNQCLLAIGQNITSMCYLDHFFHITQYWHKDEGKTRGEKPSNSYVIPVTSRGCFGVGLCWDLGKIQAMIDITSEHNVSENNQNQLSSDVLGWFHLAVTSPMEPNTSWCHHVYLGWVSTDVLEVLVQ